MTNCSWHGADHHGGPTPHTFGSMCRGPGPLTTRCQRTTRHTGNTHEHSCSTSSAQPTVTVQHIDITFGKYSDTPDLLQTCRTKDLPTPTDSEAHIDYGSSGHPRTPTHHSTTHKAHGHYFATTTAPLHHHTHSHTQTSSPPTYTHLLQHPPATETDRNIDFSSLGHTSTPTAEQAQRAKGPPLPTESEDYIDYGSSGAAQLVTSKTTTHGPHHHSTRTVTTTYTTQLLRHHSTTPRRQRTTRHIGDTTHKHSYSTSNAPPTKTERHIDVTLWTNSDTYDLLQTYRTKGPTPTDSGDHIDYGPLGHPSTPTHYDTTHKARGHYYLFATTMAAQHHHTHNHTQTSSTTTPNGTHSLQHPPTTETEGNIDFLPLGYTFTPTAEQTQRAEGPPHPTESEDYIDYRSSGAARGVTLTTTTHKPCHHSTRTVTTTYTILLLRHHTTTPPTTTSLTPTHYHNGTRCPFDIYTYGTPGIPALHQRNVDRKGGDLLPGAGVLSRSQGALPPRTGHGAHDCSTAASRGFDPDGMMEAARTHASPAEPGPTIISTGEAGSPEGGITSSRAGPLARLARSGHTNRTRSSPMTKHSSHHGTDHLGGPTPSGLHRMHRGHGPHNTTCHKLTRRARHTTQEHRSATSNSQPTETERCYDIAPLRNSDIASSQTLWTKGLHNPIASEDYFDYSSLRNVRVPTHYGTNNESHGHYSDITTTTTTQHYYLHHYTHTCTTTTPTVTDWCQHPPSTETEGTIDFPSLGHHLTPTAEHTQRAKGLPSPTESERCIHHESLGAAQVSTQSATTHSHRYHSPHSGTTTSTTLALQGAHYCRILQADHRQWKRRYILWPHQWQQVWRDLNLPPTTRSLQWMYHPGNPFGRPTRQPGVNQSDKFFGYATADELREAKRSTRTPPTPRRPFDSPPARPRPPTYPTYSTSTNPTASSSGRQAAAQTTHTAPPPTVKTPPRQTIPQRLAQPKKRTPPSRHCHESGQGGQVTKPQPSEHTTTVKTVRFSDHDKHTLTLDQALPPPRPSVTTQVGAIHNIQAHAPKVWQELDRSSLPLHQLPSAAQLAQKLAPMRTVQQNAHWHIYTDGSYDRNDPETSAWSLTCVVSDDQGFTYQGHHTARLVTSTNLHPADITSSTTTELAGILWAVLTAIGTPTTNTVTIHTDSRTAINKIQRAGGHTADDHVAKLCRFLMDQHRTIRLQHVYGHDHQPWNTTADYLANDTRLNNRCTTANTVPLYMLQYTRAMDWAWLEQGSLDEQMAYPPTQIDQHNQHYDISVALQPRRHRATEHFQPRETDAAHDRPQEPTTTQVNLSIATFNVNSLKETGQAKHRMGRASHYKAQFEQMGLHIVAIQESHRPRGTDQSHGYYHIISGPDDKGHGGMELWFSTRLHYASNDKPLCFEAKHFSILHEDHRRLIVRVAAPGLQCVVATCHALDHSKPHQLRLDWWNETRQILSRWPPQYLLIDANGRLGDIVTKHVGDAGYTQQQDDNGEELHLTAQQLDMQVTNTMYDDDQGWTWMHHKTKRTHRIDYILTASFLSHSITEVKVRHDFCLDTLEVDHLPLTATLAWTTTSRRKQQPRFKFDPRRLNDPQAQVHFASLLDAQPLPTWGTDVNQHANDTSKTMLRAATDAFPYLNDKPQRSYISMPTFDLIRKRRQVSKTLNRLPKQDQAWTAQHTLEAEAFMEEVRQWDTPHDSDSHFYAHCLQQYAATHTALTPLQHWHEWLQLLVDFVRLTKRTLNSAVSNDKALFLSNMAQAVASGREQRHTQHEWNSLRALMRFGGRQRRMPYIHPLRKTAQGRVLETQTEAADDLLRTFATSEVAQVVSPDKVIDSYNAQDNLLADDAPRNYDHIITSHELAAQIKAASRRKAAGGDVLTNDLLQSAPQSVTRHLHPLLTKIQLYAREPMMHKGVVAASIWKGKGQQCFASSFRSIALCSVVAKHHHQYLRSKLKELLGALVLTSQVGGIRHKGGDMANFLVRSRINITHLRRTSCITIFIDLTAAFYRAIRHLALPMTTNPDDLQDIVDGLSVPEALQPALKQLMEGQPLLKTAIDDRHLLHQITDAYTDTWFTVRQASSCAVAKTGTRPGDNMATDLFNIIFAPVIQLIEQDIHTAGLGWQQDHSDEAFGQSDAVQDATTSFVDDLAAQTECTTTDTIVPRARTLIQILNKHLLQYGMELNFKPGKTAVLFSVRGPGKRSADKRVWQLLQKGIHFQDGHDPLVPVKQYKHLGGIVRHDGSIHPELKLRTHAARSAGLPLKKAVYKHKQLPASMKLQYADTFVTSKLLYGAHTWSDFTNQSQQVLTTGYVSVYRDALRLPRHKDNHVTDQEVLRRAGRPDINTRLSNQRLLFIGRLLRHASSTTKCVLDQLLQLQASWMSLLEDDVRWLRCHQDQSTTSSQDTWTTWLIREVNDATHWRTLCRRAQQRSLFADQERRFTLHWRRELHDLLPNEGFARPTPSIPSRTYICYDCDHVTATARGMRIHRSKHHKPSTDPHHYIDTLVCGHCHTSYGNRAKLIQHLKTAKYCWRAWRPNLPMLDDDRKEALRLQQIADSKANHDKGQHRTYSDQPSYKLSETEWEAHCYTETTAQAALSTSDNAPQPPTSPTTRGTVPQPPHHQGQRHNTVTGTLITTTSHGSPPASTSTPTAAASPAIRGAPPPSQPGQSPCKGQSGSHIGGTQTVPDWERPFCAGGTNSANQAGRGTKEAIVRGRQGTTTCTRATDDTGTTTPSTRSATPSRPTTDRADQRSVTPRRGDSHDGDAGQVTTDSAIKNLISQFNATDQQQYEAAAIPQPVHPTTRQRRATSGALCPFGTRLRHPPRHHRDDQQEVRLFRGPQEAHADPPVDFDPEDNPQETDTEMPLYFVENPPDEQHMVNYTPRRPPADTTLCFLHLFGEPRRQGDLQDLFEKDAYTDNMNIIFLTVTEFTDLYGNNDMLRVRMWRDLIIKGQVAGMVASPSCATWSTRGTTTTCCTQRVVPGQRCRRCRRTTTRPTRTDEHIWGIPDVTVKEQQDLKFDNDHCRATLLLAWTCHLANVPFAIAQPSQYNDSGRASGWRMDEALRLAQRPDVQTVHVTHISENGKIVRPMALLHAGMPELSVALETAQDERGVDIYPTLVDHFMKAIREQHPQSLHTGIGDYDTFADVYQPLDRYKEQAS